ncbi:MAG: tRNA pseudouridine(38-40) synthase TruA [Niabella sp.]|nr:tRNA pseudouridine(38-40) synthase TruA [Niabella sp.]
MRYFLEVSYKGTHYSGFQIQQTGGTIQGAIQEALSIFLKQPFVLTGSSRTDSGVHARQNFFHFDYEQPFDPGWIYNLNAILPADIVIKNIFEVAPDAHSRFDAGSRTYQYHLYQFKDPFLADTAYYFPYKLDRAKLENAAALIKEYTDFTSFSKKNTQVKTCQCTILESEWSTTGYGLYYQVTANRFLRGMVRALVATMLKVGRGRLAPDQLQQLLEQPRFGTAFFDAPAHGLTLMKVNFPGGILEEHALPDA